MKGSFAKEEGFTLIEGLIALVILSIIAVSILSAMGFSLNSASNVSQETVAVNLARERIEAIKQFEGQSLSPADFDSRLASLVTSGSVNGTNYQISATRITNNPNIPNTVYAVQTTVGWAQKGVNRQISFTTYYLR